MPVVREIHALFLGDSEALAHFDEQRALRVDRAEDLDVLRPVATALHRFRRDLDETIRGHRIESRLHLRRIAHVEHMATVAHRRLARRLTRAARGDHDVIGERAVGEAGRLEHVVFWMIAAEQRRRAARAEAEHEARALVGVVDEVVLASSAGEEHLIDVVAAEDESLRDLHRDRRAGADALDVVGERACGRGAEKLLDLWPCAPHREVAIRAAHVQQHVDTATAVLRQDE